MIKCSRSVPTESNLCGNRPHLGLSERGSGMPDFVRYIKLGGALLFVGGFIFFVAARPATTSDSTFQFGLCFVLMAVGATLFVMPGSENRRRTNARIANTMLRHESVVVAGLAIAAAVSAIGGLIAMMNLVVVLGVDFDRVRPWVDLCLVNAVVLLCTRWCYYQMCDRMHESRLPEAHVD